jgi:hypothetical protein
MMQNKPAEPNSVVLSQRFYIAMITTGGSVALALLAWMAWLALHLAGTVPSGGLIPPWDTHDVFNSLLRQAVLAEATVHCLGLAP